MATVGEFEVTRIDAFLVRQPVVPSGRAAVLPRRSRSLGAAIEVGADSFEHRLVGFPNLDIQV
jgi:hypothetical protein